MERTTGAGPHYERCSLVLTSHCPSPQPRTLHAVDATLFAVQSSSQSIPVAVLAWTAVVISASSSSSGSIFKDQQQLLAVENAACCSRGRLAVLGVELREPRVSGVLLVAVSVACAKVAVGRKKAAKKFTHKIGDFKWQ